MLHYPSNVSHVQFISKYGTQFETSYSNSYSPNLKPMCLLNTNYYNYISIIISLTCFQFDLELDKLSRSSLIKVI